MINNLNLFLRGLSSVFILSNLGNLFSYIFIFILGRYLNNHDFSIFMTLNSFIAILISPIAFSPMVLSKSFINNFSFSDLLKSNYIKNLIFLTIFLVIILDLIFLAFFNQIKLVLNYDNHFHILLSLIIINLSYISIPMHGIFQGARLFFKFSLIASMPMFLKVLFVFVFFYFLLDLSLLDLVLYSIISAITLTIIISVYFLLKSFNLRLGGFSKNVIFDIFKSFKDFQFILICNIYYLFLISVDIIIANNIFNSEETANYSKLSVIAKSIFYLFSSLSAVIFPIAVQNKFDNNLRESIKNLLQGTLIFLVISSVVVIIFYFFYDLIFFYSFNISLPEYKNIFTIQSINYCILALSQFIAVFNIANSKNNFVYFFFILTILHLITGLIYIKSLTGLIYLNLIISSLTLLIVVYQSIKVSNEK